MLQNIRSVIYPVSDIEQARTFYQELLGVQPYMAESYYVGFKVGDLDVGLDPHGHRKGLTGPVCYWQVADIKKTLDLLLANGAQIQQEVKDVGGGKLIATVKDANDNITGLMQLPQQ